MEKLEISLRWNFIHILMGSGGCLIENVLTFTDKLNPSRSQTCEISFWPILRFLLDKFLPDFNTE